MFARPPQAASCRSAWRSASAFPSPCPRAMSSPDSPPVSGLGTPPAVSHQISPDPHTLAKHWARVFEPVDARTPPGLREQQHRTALTQLDYFVAQGYQECAASSDELLRQLPDSARPAVLQSRATLVQEIVTASQDPVTGAPATAEQRLQGIAAAISRAGDYVTGLQATGLDAHATHLTQCIYEQVIDRAEQATAIVRARELGVDDATIVRAIVAHKGFLSAVPPTASERWATRVFGPHSRGPRPVTVDDSMAVAAPYNQPLRDIKVALQPHRAHVRPLLVGPSQQVVWRTDCDQEARWRGWPEADPRARLRIASELLEALRHDLQESAADPQAVASRLGWFLARRAEEQQAVAAVDRHRQAAANTPLGAAHYYLTLAPTERDFAVRGGVVADWAEAHMPPSWILEHIRTWEDEGLSPGVGGRLSALARGSARQGLAEAPRLNGVPSEAARALLALTASIRTAVRVDSWAAFSPRERQQVVAAFGHGPDLTPHDLDAAVCWLQADAHRRALDSGDNRRLAEKAEDALMLGLRQRLLRTELSQLDAEAMAGGEALPREREVPLAYAGSAIVTPPDLTRATNAFGQPICETEQLMHDVLGGDRAAQGTEQAACQPTADRPATRGGARQRSRRTPT